MKVYIKHIMVVNATFSSLFLSSTRVFQEWMRPLIQSTFVHFKQIYLPASFQSKRPEQWHTSLDFVAIAQMCGHWKTVDLRAEQKLNLHQEAFL